MKIHTNISIQDPMEGTFDDDLLVVDLFNPVDLERDQVKEWQLDLLESMKKAIQKPERTGPPERKINP